MWDQACHSTVPWEEVGGILVQRSRRGSLIFEIATPVLSGFGSAAAPIIIEKLRENSDNNHDESFQTNLEEVLPFITQSDFFVGNRHHWSSDDPIGPKDKEVIELLTEFFTQLNIEIMQTEPSEVTEVDETVEFDRHLVSLGGPIPNWYSRNLIYGPEVETPYKFCLNPEPDRLDLSDYGPRELRTLGRKDHSEFVGEPNWYLANTAGDRAVVDNADAIPLYREEPDGVKPKLWYRDYFTIIKAPNIHPSATPYAQSLVIAGCHGLGGLASIHALQDPDLISKIRAEAGDGYFQAVGRVQETADDEYKITLPEIEPLGRDAISGLNRR